MTTFRDHVDDCTCEGCDRPIRCRGLCGKHYARLLKWGDPNLGGRPTVEVRFWEKVAPTGFCWEWGGSTDDLRYGHFNASGGKWIGAHRMAYQLLVGPIPEGKELDHLCRNPNCVNPDHLDPVTRPEHGQRSIKARQSHCSRGHEFTPENTYRRPDRPRNRDCRICRTEATRRSRAISR